MEKRSYRGFIIYCLLAIVVSIIISYLKCQWSWPRLLSFGWVINIFWLCLATYFIVRGRNVRMKWDVTVKPIAHVSLRATLSLFILLCFFFIFPEFFLDPLISFSSLMYLRTLLLVSLFIGFSSAVAFSLGWATSIQISQDKKGSLVRVLSNLVVAISFFGIIMAVFSHIAPSELWIERIPENFSGEDLLGLFGQYASTILYFSSICIGLSFVTTGIMMRMVSEDANRLFFFLGILFCSSIGLLLGYLMGPLVFFAVTEVVFASGAMICIGLITCMLST